MRAGQYIEIRYDNGCSRGILRSIKDGWLSIELGELVHHITDDADTFLPTGGFAMVKEDRVWLVIH